MSRASASLMARVLAVCGEFGEEDRPDGADEPEGHEDAAPAEMLTEEEDEHRRRRPAEAGEGPQQALGEAALTIREPVAEQLRRVRIRPCLADAEKEADDDEGREAAEHEAADLEPEIPDEPGEGGEDGPPDDDAKEDAARSSRSPSQPLGTSKIE